MTVRLHIIFVLILRNSLSVATCDSHNKHTVKTAQRRTSHIAEPSGRTVYEFHGCDAQIVNLSPTGSQEISLRYFRVLRRSQLCEGTTLSPRSHSRCLQITLRKVDFACINNDQVTQKEFFLSSVDQAHQDEFFLIT